MSRTLLTTLALFAVVGWLVASPPVDASGAEECLGCRRLRGVELRFGFRTAELEQPGRTDRWVAKHLPEHAHHFVRVGAWERGDRFDVQPQPAQFGIPSALWLEFLKSLPLVDAREAVAAFNGDRDDAAIVAAFEAYDHWLPTRRDGFGREECTGCRRRRSVVIERGVRTTNAAPPLEVEEWIREHVPEHTHSFSLVGCWNNGEILANLATPLALRVDPAAWLEFLQSLPADEAADAVEAFTRNTSEFFEWYERVRGPDWDKDC